MQARTSQGKYRVMTTGLDNQKGAVSVLYVLMLPALLGFAALSIDVGSWYVVKAELSKSVDAAAVAGARNISNPYVDPKTLAAEFGQENFPTARLGVKGPATFVGSLSDQTVSVTGTVSASAYLATLFGITQVAYTNVGAAKKNNVEILLVLDRSGSMAGQAILDLKSAATQFINFFKDTQADDRLGLISFATGVTVDFGLCKNFVTTMTTKIGAMAAVGATNAEDALAQAAVPAPNTTCPPTAGNPGGLTDQSTKPGDQRVQQFLIFFSDGNPTAFRGKFKLPAQGNLGAVDNFDAVVCGLGQDCSEVYNQLGSPGAENWLAYDPRLTGDGKAKGATSCTALPPLLTAKWYIFSTYPVASYGVEACFIPTVNTTKSGQSGNYTYKLNSVTGKLSAYVCTTARTMAIAKAQALKDKFVKIYTIGLGAGIDSDFLAQIASGPSYMYTAPSSSQLQAIFNTIAKDIKLRLVQ